MATDNFPNAATGITGGKIDLELKERADRIENNEREPANIVTLDARENERLRTCLNSFRLLGEQYRHRVEKTRAAMEQE